MIMTYIFFSIRVSFTNIDDSQGSMGRGEANSLTPRHEQGNYYKELTSAHSYSLNPNLGPLVSKHKSLDTKLHVLLCL